MADALRHEGWCWSSPCPGGWCWRCRCSPFAVVFNVCGVLDVWIGLEIWKLKNINFNGHSRIGVSANFTMSIIYIFVTPKSTQQAQYFEHNIIFAHHNITTSTGSLSFLFVQRSHSSLLSMDLSSSNRRNTFPFKDFLLEMFKTSTFQSILSVKSTGPLFTHYWGFWDSSALAALLTSWKSTGFIR